MAAAIASIRQGVFFTTPPALPRGRHAIPRAEIRAAQRERLMIACTELMAHSGYARIKVRDIAVRAGVSLQVFYALFGEKQDCAFAAYDRFIEVLLGRVSAERPGADWLEYFDAVVVAYLGTLEADPVVGRAFQLEMDAVGRPARQRRVKALRQFARVLHSRHEVMRAGDSALAPLPEDAFLAMVYAVRQLASDALDARRRPRLLELAPDVQLWTNAAFYGAADAAIRVRNVTPI